MPGLGAGPQIFDTIHLDKNKFELHYLDWLIPESINETLNDYVKRLVQNIAHTNPVLVGVSFGGMVVQEMSKYVDAKKIIIISSVKSRDELPRRLKIIRATKLYKLFPANKIAKTKSFPMLKFHKTLRKKIELYNKYLNIRDRDYLKWAVYNVLSWNPNAINKDVIHIHGSKDEIFPIKNIKDCLEIKDGTHVMILNKGKKISAVLEGIF